MKNPNSIRGYVRLLTVLLLSLSMTFSAQNLSSNINFTENKGQISDQDAKARPDVVFSGSGKGFDFHLRNNGISYQLRRVDSWTETGIKQGEKIKIAGKTSIYRIDLNWPGANTHCVIIQDEALPGYSNFYTGSAAKGIHYVKTYTGIMYKDLYKNIDLHYYEKNGDLKYDYIVKPGADHKQIRIEVKGAQSLRLNAGGDLEITTPFGTLTEAAPLVYQKNKQLKARWRIDDLTLSFDIEAYDASHELIIDPILRAWGTLYGGSRDEVGWTTCTDGNGNAYLGGMSTSDNQIATSGSHQYTVTAYLSNGFLSKFNSNGVRIWSTYYGGWGYDEIHSCAVDLSGNVYATGFTGVSDPFQNGEIATPGSHQDNLGGALDAFLVKFNSNGIRVWGTYYGGYAADNGETCATDLNGNVYIAGNTKEDIGMGMSTAIATANGHQTLPGGEYDCFLVKFNSSGVRQWASYYGGDGDDFSGSLSTDPQGNIFLSGLTSSTTGIASGGAHQSTYGGGPSDGFLVKFNSNGVRQWATYYGGAGRDNSSACVTDASGNVFFTGGTSSSSLIATPGSHQSSMKGISDGFIAKFNPIGARLWATYYGGLKTEYLISIARDVQSNIYVTGTSSSSDNASISTGNSHQTTLTGSLSVVLAKFSSGGSLIAGTYYGSLSPNTSAAACAVDDLYNEVYITGCIAASDSLGMTTAGCHQSAYGGGTLDAFFAKFVEGLTVGIAEQTENNSSFVLYPNPGQNMFTLKCNEDLSGTSRIDIFNAIGDHILSEKTNYPETQVDLGSYPSGMYIFKIHNEKKTCVLKAIKE